MSVGSFGGIVFSVSKKKVNSFSNFKRSRNAEWKEHSRYGKKPISQFISPGLESITMDIHLDATMGVKPRKMIDKWGKLLEAGHHDVFVIGSTQVGKYEWKIESISEAWNIIMNKGELISADITVTMSEYLNSDSVAKKSNSTKKKKSTLSSLSTSSGLVKGRTYKVKTLLTGYYTAIEAKKLSATNKTGKIYPGTYYIYNISSGMLNVTKVKGSPGSWINPTKNK